jgi:hypothetical protein
MAGLIKEISGPFWYIVQNMLRKTSVRIDRAGEFVEITAAGKTKRYSFDQIEAELADARESDRQ